MPRRFEDNAPAAGRFVDGDERDDYTDRPMKLQTARFEPKATYGPRWVITAAMLDTGELVAIALADNATRTQRFSEVQADLAADGADAYEPVCLFRQGRVDGGNPFWTFRTATADEIAEAAETLAAGPADDDGDEGDEGAASVAADNKKRGK